MSEHSSFGAWVRRRRKALDLTREELAPRLGCSVVTIRRIEAGERRPSKQLADRLADCLEITTEERLAFLKAARGELAVDRPVATGAPVERSIDGAIAPAARDTQERSLPSGTVTFLFTDIEGSTRLWEQHSSAMPLALARHTAILHQAIAAQGGVVFKTVGDAVCAAFGSAPAALEAALPAQRKLQAEDWGAPGPLRVRIALHTGTATPHAVDYLGPPLNRVARLLAASFRGQIVLSGTTAPRWRRPALRDSRAGSRDHLAGHLARAAASARRVGL